MQGNKNVKIILYLCGLLYSSKHFIRLIRTFYRLFLRTKLNLAERYGLNSYALVSGANNVLGREISKQLALKGFNIILLAGDMEQLVWLSRELSHEIPGKEFRVLSVNLEDCSSDQFFNNIKDQIKDLDISILINNTDTDLYSSFDKVSVNQYKSMIFMNCIPPVLMTRTLLPQMVKRSFKSAVINVSCGAAVFPMAYYSAYVGTKALVDNFTQSLSMEFTDVDIMLYTPFDFVEKKGDEMYDMMTITAEESVKGALEDLGHQMKTFGHWKHRVQGYFYEKLPRWLFKYVYLEQVAPYFIKPNTELPSPRKKLVENNF